MRPRSRLLVFAAAAAILAACSTGAAPSVSGAWARPAPVDGVSAAYFTISAPSGADALLSATSPAAEMVEIHETATDGTGMTGMDAVARVDVPAGGSVEFKPGGRHLMLMGLTGALTPGSTIELDLVFEHAGKVVVQAEIRQG